MIKKRLAGNQAIIAYKQKVGAYRGHFVNVNLFAKRQNTKFTASGGQVVLVKNDIKVDIIFEVVRRNPGWEEKFMEKMKLYENFYKNFQAKDCGFDKKPQLIIIGEDDNHLVEIFKNFMRVQADLEGIEVFYTTDLRQLEESLETSLIAFRLNEQTGRYQKEIIQTPLLEK